MFSPFPLQGIPGSPLSPLLPGAEIPGRPLSPLGPGQPSDPLSEIRCLNYEFIIFQILS